MGCAGYYGMTALNIIQALIAFITGVIGFLLLTEKESRWYAVIFIGITIGLILLMVFVTFPYMDTMLKECHSEDGVVTGIQT